MSKEINRDSFINKYGRFELTFDYYYKYRFFYSGWTDAKQHIEVSCGGDSSDIYRDEYSAKETVASLDPNQGAITDVHGNIEEFDEVS